VGLKLNGWQRTLVGWPRRHHYSTHALKSVLDLKLQVLSAQFLAGRLALESQ
jgi:hypothetical protein